MSTDTKKILVSPGYGAGFATWSTESKKLAEDPELIAMVEKGEHLGSTTCGDLRASGCSLISDDMNGDIEASLPFIKRATEVNGGYVYSGGIYQLEVQTVSGPYRIDEYDGSESVTTVSDLWT